MVVRSTDKMQENIGREREAQPPRSQQIITDQTIEKRRYAPGLLQRDRDSWADSYLSALFSQVTLIIIASTDTLHFSLLQMQKLVLTQCKCFYHSFITLLLAILFVLISHHIFCYIDIFLNIYLYRQETPNTAAKEPFSPGRSILKSTQKALSHEVVY